MFETRTISLTIMTTRERLSTHFLSQFRVRTRYCATECIRNRRATDDWWHSNGVASFADRSTEIDLWRNRRRSEWTRQHRPASRGIDATRCSRWRSSAPRGEQTSPIRLVRIQSITEVSSAGLEMFCSAQCCFKSIDRNHAIVGTLKETSIYLHSPSSSVSGELTDWERNDAWSAHWLSIRWKISSKAWQAGEQTLELWITCR